MKAFIGRLALSGELSLYREDDFFLCDLIGDWGNDLDNYSNELEPFLDCN